MISYITPIADFRVQRRIRLYRANVLLASAHGFLCLYESSTYVLLTPHAVGWVYAGIGGMILTICSVHCLLLATSHRALLSRRDRWLPVLPALICLLSLLVCGLRHYLQPPLGLVIFWRKTLAVAEMRLARYPAA